MAINVGYEILIDSSVSADDKSKLVGRILQALQPEGLSIAYATTYAAGSGSTNQASIAVGGSSPDLGVRVIMDSAVVGTNKVATILQRLIAILGSETITLSHAAAYAAGTRTYNVTATVT